MLRISSRSTGVSLELVDTCVYPIIQNRSNHIALLALTSIALWKGIRNSLEERSDSS